MEGMELVTAVVIIGVVVIAWGNVVVVVVVACVGCPGSGVELRRGRWWG